MTTTAYRGPDLDISSTKQVPLARMVRLELRKMVDTRAGLWLIIATAAVTALVLVIQLWVGIAQDLSLTLRAFMTGMNTPMGVFLPVLGIMAVTSEWGQRTALTTFSLMPSRSKVMGAKFAAMMLVAVVAIIVGFGLAAAANVLFGILSDTETVWNLGAADLAKYFLLHVIGMATGFAFGALLLNTAAAIVIYFVYSFVLPGLFALGAQLIGWFGDLQPWIDFNAAQVPLIDGAMTAKQWQHLAVSSVPWFFLPLALGMWRVLRAEVK
ncbi:MAG: ABC transporter permease [Nocardioides sp.]